MKEMFKKGFGLTMGIFTGVYVCNFLCEIHNELRGNCNISKKEESVFEEES